MSRFFLVPLAVVLVLIGSSSGHEIKAFVSNPNLAAGGKTTVYLSWGHRLPVDDLVEATTLARYDLVDPTGQVKPLKTSDRSLQTNVVELQTEGTHQVVVARKSSLYTYVFDEDGTRQLKRGGKKDHAGAKIDAATKSLQCAKALVVVGKPSDKAPSPVGLPIEIVPLDGPSQWVSTNTLRFRVLVDGKPLSSVEVQARPVGSRPENAWSYATLSNKQGEFTIKPSQAGTWVVKVYTRNLAPARSRDEYDLESFTATLSLEVAP
ncbi:MAG: DUF4198 domain-containing protein [Gemmataceae bacterium]